ncbi:MAG: DUF1343 domain-containing protein [Candidatus Krumholzibacteria bacterium]|nr:DUF1343 domain-containing protein [Candidatus Krumholzibacteria bacterium]
MRPAVELIRESGAVDLKALFGPQHGILGQTQDNMIEWEGFTDGGTGLPIHSLYGKHRKPTSAMLDDLDVLVIDLQDVGARYYTFIWTMLLCMEACAEHGVQVMVLDRPNPIGGHITEGTVLDPEFRSFVGLAPIPMRHGMTAGELALFFVRWLELDLDLEVVWMEGWKRDMDFASTGLPWVLPSPNMPTPDTALVYPGACLLEGTTLSEGRGTTRPFEMFGAPYVDPETLAGALTDWNLPGCRFRPLHFEPTFHKYAGEVCGGVQVHVTDPATFESVTTYTAAIAAIRNHWPDGFAWKLPPYEYETEKLPIDILAGGEGWRNGVEAGLSPWRMKTDWMEQLKAFEEMTAEFRRYE